MNYLPPRDGSFSFFFKRSFHNENDDKKRKTKRSFFNGNRFKNGRFQNDRFQKQSFLKIKSFC